MITGKKPESAITKIQVAAFLRKVERHTNMNGNFYVEIRGSYKRCVKKTEVANLLVDTHDESVHFGVAITMKKLKP